MPDMDTEWDHGKSTEGYRLLGSSLEPTRVPSATGLTPVPEFFVCSAGDALDIDPPRWSLRVCGAVTRNINLGLKDLVALTQHELPAWLECAGNGRRLFSEAAGHAVPADGADTPWLLNAMGLATWSGPRLGDILELAGVHASAKWVSPCGLDEDNREREAPRMCLPISKALHEDTIVALAMNGEPLTRSHGAPARLVVPGWVGAYSMKWLGELTVAEDWVGSWRADEYYVYRDANGAAGPPLTAHPVKSNLALEFPAALRAGEQQVRGFARSGEAPVVDVRWRIDGGAWHAATLGSALGRWAWTLFSFTLDLEAGNHIIETRAADAAGNVQPAVQAPHPNGVLWNAITPHPVVVGSLDVPGVEPVSD